MHVVVLGAGVVGVTTAWQLLEDGHEVTRDRSPARGGARDQLRQCRPCRGRPCADLGQSARAQDACQVAGSGRPAAALPVPRRPGVLALVARFRAAVHRGPGTAQHAESSIACAATHSRPCSRWSPIPGSSTTAPGSGSCICIAPRRRSSAAPRTCASWPRPARRWRWSTASGRQRSIRRWARPRTGSRVRSTAQPTRAAIAPGSAGSSRRAAPGAAPASSMAPRSKASMPWAIRSRACAPTTARCRATATCWRSAATARCSRVSASASRCTRSRAIR